MELPPWSSVTQSRTRKLSLIVLTDDSVFVSCIMMDRYSRNVTSKLLGTVGLGSWDCWTWVVGSPLDETTETTDV